MRIELKSIKMNQIANTQVWSVVGAIGVIALIGYSFLHFLAAGRDDTFIMLWAGQTLGHAPWFMNFNYATQEIASSTIGVLIAALTKGQSIGHALLLVKLFGLLSACATLYLIWWKRVEIFSGSQRSRWLALATIISTVASPVFMYWSLGGLETPQHALLLLVYCLVLIKSLTASKQLGQVDWWLWGTGFLLVLVRTEAFWPIFFAGLLLVLINRSSSVPIQTVRAVFLTVVLFILLLVLRYVFTGAWWPNPVYAKVGDYSAAIPAGLEYVSNYFLTSPWTWVQGFAVVYGVSRLLTLCLCLMKRQALANQRLLLEAVLGGTVLFQLIFVVLTGGNWMEYFRFMAAIVPLMNILVFMMLAHFVPNQDSVLLLIGAFVLLVILALTQIGRAGEYYAGDCSKPISASVALSGLEGLSRAVIQNNCAHSRDLKSIKPFIDEKIPELLRNNNGRLTVASYQAGFFPYHLRKKYNQQEIFFIDSAGLTELEIARLPGGTSSGGIRFRDRIDLALLGEVGALSQYFLSHHVNLVYLLSASPEVRKNMEKLGYETVWDVAGAVVFYHPSNR